MNYKSIVTLFILYFLSQECFSQSKKVQIAILNFQLDSLKQEIESRNEKIKSNNNLTSELQYKIKLIEKQLSESQKLVLNLESKSDSLKSLNRKFSLLKIELKSTKEKHDALLHSLAECNDKFANINFLENPPIQLDTIELEKLAHRLIIDPCPEDMMLKENSCTTEFPIKQFFKLGSKTYFISMVNFSFDGYGAANGKSLVLLFQVMDSKLIMLDSLSLGGSRYGQGLSFTNDKYLIGKQSFAFHLIGGQGGAGGSIGIDYFIAFLNNKLFEVYNGEGSGDYFAEGTSWDSQYSFTPSNNDMYNMVITVEQYKSIKGKNKKSIKNTVYHFSNQEKKYIETVK